MALHHFHYLITATGLTVWLHAPAVVLACLWAFQAILYIAGIDVLDVADFIFWQFLTSLAGVAIGMGILIITRAPPMLRFQESYATNLGHFLIWLAFFIGAQLFYAFFPPPGQAWGIVGTVVAIIILHVLLFVSMLYNEVAFRGYVARGYFFLLWIVVITVMQLCFFIAYALAERWAAYIAAGAGLAILITVALVIPLRIPYRPLSTVSNEPLVSPALTVAGDGEEDGPY